MKLKCNLCQNSNFVKLYQISHFKKPFQIVKCKTCGLIFMNPQPPTSELFSIYNQNYFEGKGEFTYQDERKKPHLKILYEKRIENIENFTNKGKILDVGCAFGYFLKTAQERGWEVYGVEISEYASNFAQKELQLNVFRGELQEADFPSNFFDAITMIELIEHLNDPLATLNETFRILKPEGLLIIQTANARSLKAKLSGAKWEYFQPGHLYYFDRTTLTKMLKKSNFQIVKFYAGDELGMKAKWKSCSLKYKKKNKVIRWQKCLQAVSKHLLRKISLGNFTIGGMVIYAKKTPTSAR